VVFEINAPYYNFMENDGTGRMVFFLRSYNFVFGFLCTLNYKRKKQKLFSQKNLRFSNPGYMYHGLSEVLDHTTHYTVYTDLRLDMNECHVRLT